MSEIDRYFWLVCVVLGSAIILIARAELRIRGFRSALAALAILNMPFLLTGYGMLVSPRPRNTVDLFSPRSGWIALALVASAAANWVAILWWIFAARGAERLAAAPRILKSLNLPNDADAIRLFTIACILGGVVGIVMLVLTQR